MIATAPIGDARAWIERAFCDGSQLACAVAGRVTSKWSGVVLGAEDSAISEPISNVGGRRGRRYADADLVDMFDSRLAPTRSLFVEDDMWRTGEPSESGENAVTVDDRLVRWSDTASADELLRLVSIGSSGWPLIAWGCSAPPAKYGLGLPGKVADLAAIAASATFVCTLAFDGEAFVVCHRKT